MFNEVVTGYKPYISIIAPACTFLPLIICVIITHIKHIYVGGLIWPFFSDMGRDPPNYYVFVIGLCSTAILSVPMWYWNYMYQTEVMERLKVNSKRLSLLSFISAFCGILATPGLVLLVSFLFPPF